MSPIGILTIVLGYFGLLILLSRLTSKQGKNEDFYIGARKSPWYLVAYGMIGASLSGVTFLSVPGWVGASSFGYMQMVLGYFLGYLVISYVLLPVYYKLNLTSIYGYLEQRYGESARTTGAIFFLLSRIIGASFRLYLVALVLQIAVFDPLGVQFWQTVIVTIALIWVYTYKGGIRTIVWTDTLQTTFLILAAIISVVWLTGELIPEGDTLVGFVSRSPMSRIWFVDEPSNPQFFLRQFLSGALITIVMTGLDQDMMQKNLSCPSLKEAQKNMLWFSLILIGVNLLFLSLGLLLHEYAGLNSIQASGDKLFPTVILEHSGSALLIGVFLIGLIAAAYSSADSALTALTTSFCVDILGRKREVKKDIRMLVHIGFSVVLMVVVVVFKYAINDPHVISNLFKAAGYTYGPLLGLFAFGLFTKYEFSVGWYIPLISVVAPICTWLISLVLSSKFHFQLGFEVLALNGLLMIVLLYIGKIPKKNI